MQGLRDIKTNVEWSGIVETQEKAKRNSYVLFTGKAEGETVIEDSATENLLKKKNSRMKEEKGKKDGFSV